VIVGPNQSLAIEIIDRMRQLFYPHGIYFDTKQTLIEFPNGCKIMAMPSYHIDAVRSLKNLKLAIIDEADYFRTSDKDAVRACIEGYILKSDPIICMISTPNAPLGCRGLTFAFTNTITTSFIIYKQLNTSS
jgi:hypothetical protein